MKTAIAATAVALGLAACTQNGGDNNMLEENSAIGAGANEPATTDLDLNSSASETDRAINETDQQSDLGEVADNAADSVENSVQ